MIYNICLILSPTSLFSRLIFEHPHTPPYSPVFGRLLERCERPGTESEAEKNGVDENGEAGEVCWSAIIAYLGQLCEKHSTSPGVLRYPLLRISFGNALQGRYPQRVLWRVLDSLWTLFIKLLRLNLDWPSPLGLRT